MLQVSAALAALIDTAPSQLHLTLADSSQVPAAAVKSAEWSGGSNAGDDITLGSTVATQLTVELDRAKLGGIKLTDARLTVSLTLEGSEEPIPVAALQVDDVDGDDDTVTITACDAMVWAFGEQYALDDAALGFDWNAGVDGETLLKAVCDACGVPLRTTGLPPITLTTVNASGYTYREIIAFLACMWGRNARIDGYGWLVLQWYTAAERPIGPDRYYEGELTKADYDYTVGYIKCYVEPLEETLVAGDASQAQGIYIKCPWMTPEYLQAVWDAIGGFAYRPVSGLRFFGDPRLEPGDVLQVTDRDGTTYAVPCMTLTQEYDGGLISEITAVGKSISASEQDYQGPVTRDIERVVEGIEASLIKYQDRIEATVKGLDGQIADVELTVDSITSRVQDAEGNISELKSTVQGITMRVEDVEGNYSSLEEYIDSLTLTVSNGAASSAIELTAGDITLASEQITLSGLVTYAEDGSPSYVCVTSDGFYLYHTDVTNPKAALHATSDGNLIQLILGAGASDAPDAPARLFVEKTYVNGSIYYVSPTTGKTVGFSFENDGAINVMGNLCMADGSTVQLGGSTVDFTDAAVVGLTVKAVFA